MRLIIFSILLLATGPASANDYYYVIYNIPPLADAHFASADETCHAAYDYSQSVIFPARAGKNPVAPLPYQPPTVFQSYPPKVLVYGCHTSATISFLDSNGNVTSTSVTSIGYYISREGNNCQDGQYYNPVSGACQTSDQEQPYKELGNPNNPAVVGVVSCGDPINVGTGNVFEEEVDYEDTDGELRFSRTYNSEIGTWDHSYAALLAPVDPHSLAMNFADGRQSVFAVENNVATAEPGEMGTATYQGGQWTYAAPTNEKMTFDYPRGRLIRWQNANGLAQTLSYVTDTAYNTTATVTDSRGHKLTFVADVSGRLSKMTAGDLVVSYQFDASARLASVTRSWPGHAATRTFLYEDEANPKKITGLIDERGVRSASWTYDSQGRALSNELAGGANKVSVVYADDGSATVMNALGHAVVYRYSVVQGVKRVTAIEGEPAPGCPAANSSYTYTVNGQVATKTDALGHVTSYTYDALGRETRRVEAEGSIQARTTSTTWDGESFRPATVTSVDRITTYSYDPKGRLLSTNVHSIKE
ncbi:YD repeat-containing protein [Luteibacter rhizovicinus]|uniref:YD repeat-containing protein n=1 Tax=Luteibacter rhizovicinus TaxID=242606 RepID=A0A4R3YV34_9GAMM|nr:DUF6531 domain-containing protein [Luteibacter rhizovicinus]TCV96352.1 YD repeat-containing protein [Luteibacter rhizovicinus]